MKTVNTLNKLITLALALAATSAVAAEQIPLNELKNNRLGSIVENRETGEQIYLACIEKEEGVCTQYRFVDDLGVEVRLMGNKAIEPVRNSDGKPFATYKMFNGSTKKAFPAMSYLADQWERELAPQGLTQGALLVFTMVPFLTPLSAVYHSAFVAYDTVRLAILLPGESIKAIVLGSKSHRLNKAFSSLFSPKYQRSGDTFTLHKASRFSAFKNMITTIATSK